MPTERRHWWKCMPSWLAQAYNIPVAYRHGIAIRIPSEGTMLVWAKSGAQTRCIWCSFLDGLLFVGEWPGQNKDHCWRMVAWMWSQLNGENCVKTIVKQTFTDKNSRKKLFFKEFFKKWFEDFSKIFLFDSLFWKSAN